MVFGNTILPGKRAAILSGLGIVFCVFLLAWFSQRNKEIEDLSRKVKVGLEMRNPGVSVSIKGPYDYAVGRARLIELLDARSDKLDSILKQSKIAEFIDQAKLEGNITWEFDSDPKSWESLRGIQGLLVSTAEGDIITVVVIKIN